MIDKKENETDVEYLRRLRDEASRILPAGQAVYYLGRRMVVKCHICDLDKLQVFVCFDYADNHGVIHSRDIGSEFVIILFNNNEMTYATETLGRKDLSP